MTLHYLVPNGLRLPSEAALTAAKRVGRAILVLPGGKTERVTFPCGNCGAPLAEHTHGPLVDGRCARTGCLEYVP